MKINNSNIAFQIWFVNIFFFFFEMQYNTKPREILSVYYGFIWFYF